jgi:hypothetical protein
MQGEPRPIAQLSGLHSGSSALDGQFRGVSASGADAVASCSPSSQAEGAGDDGGEHLRSAAFARATVGPCSAQSRCSRSPQTNLEAQARPSSPNPARPSWSRACAAACCPRTAAAGPGCAQQMRPGVAQPPGLAGAPEQSLQHRQRQQLGVADPRHDPHPRPRRDPLALSLQQNVGRHEERGDYGVQIGARGPPRRLWTPFSRKQLKPSRTDSLDLLV